MTVYLGADFSRQPANAGNNAFGKKDLEFLSNNRRFPEIISVSPSSSINLRISAGKLSLDVNAWGVSEDYMEMRGWQLTEGRFFTESEREASRPAVVIGSEVAKTLFPEHPDSILQKV